MNRLKIFKKFENSLKNNLKKFEKSGKSLNTLEKCEDSSEI